jgi:hypothetical protein
MPIPRSSAIAAVRRLTAVLAGLAIIGCFVVRTVRVESVPVGTSDSTTVRSPVKAHLVDGSIVVFPKGVTVVRNTVQGSGRRYDLAAAESTSVLEIRLDSIIAMESFRTEIDGARTFMYSTLAVIATIGGGIALACIADPKCFGSCPTIYADSAGTPVLEAEGFSGSISPLLEARDVDRLRTRADANGFVRLEVWNEALETHYINHLELLEVEHAASEMVLPDERGRPVAVGNELAMASVSDRLGRDLRAPLTRTDGNVFSSDPRLIAGATPTDLYDDIFVTVPRPKGADSAAVVLRVRSSLLNTLVFYDYMLAKPGARSLDWMSTDLMRLDRVAELGRWYSQYFGIRIAVQDGGAYRDVAKISDYGPIAWRDVAVVVPATGTDSIRLRLSFLTDQWRIDRLAVAGAVRRPTQRTIPVTSITSRDPAFDAGARAAVREPDTHYLETSPRQRFTVAFDVGKDAGGSSSRTFLLASQGYYIEWVRGSWMTGQRDTTTFVPTVETLVRAMRDWGVQRDSMERQFFLSRIPVY